MLNPYYNELHKKEAGLTSSDSFIVKDGNE